jgi:HAD superfamily hydrolase (TIGR01509 family)
MIRALILDFDGLIVDTETPLRDAWMEVYSGAGLSIDDVEWARILGASADPSEAYEILETHLGRSIDREALHTRQLRREAEILAGADTLPGVREILTSAKEAGLLLGIASSSERAWVSDHLASRGLFERFDAIACAEDVPLTKPAPDLYVHVLRTLGVHAREAIAFEDSEHGVAAAKAADLYCVAVPNPVTRCLDFRSADLVVPSLLARTLGEYLDGAARSGRH